MSSLPNILTLSRIFAVPLLAFFLWWPDWRLGYLIGFVLYSVIAITDYIDGYLARAQGTVSKLGTFLDPIADKLLLVSVFVVLGHMGELPLWLVIAVVSRDALIVGAVLLSYVMPAAANADRITTEGVNYRTTTGFNVAAVAVIAILIALYATWW